MQYYKIIKDKKIIDVLQEIIYVKYQKRNKLMLRCKEQDNPMGVLSSCQSTIYHVEGMKKFPMDKYMTVEMYECDEAEYLSLKAVLDENKVVEEIATETYENDTDEVTISGIYTSDVDLDGDGILDPLDEDDCMTIDFVKASKINALSKICSKTIVEGFDVVLSDGNNYHFSLKIVDQIKIRDLKIKVNAGETLLYYHADGQLCQYFSSDDVNLIYQYMEMIIDYNTTYFNSMKNYILSIKDINIISAIQYGDEVPEEYQSDVLKYVSTNAVSLISN